MAASAKKTVHDVSHEVVGMEKKAAEAFIAEAGFTSHVVMIHGAGVARLNDHNPTRVKLFLENDKVSDTRVG